MKNNTNEGIFFGAALILYDTGLRSHIRGEAPLTKRKGNQISLQIRWIYGEKLLPPVIGNTVSLSF